MNHSTFTDASCIHPTYCFSLYCIKAITYNYCCYNNSQNKVLFWTSKHFPTSIAFTVRGCLYKRLHDYTGGRNLKRRITSLFQVHRMSFASALPADPDLKFYLVTSSMVLNLEDVWIKHHCYMHSGATSSAEAGNRRSVSLEYLEYPLWKIKVFLGVKRDTVFSQMSVGETFFCLFSRTLLRCSTPLEHFLSRHTILPLREKQIFTWETKVYFEHTYKAFENIYIWKTTA